MSYEIASKFEWNSGKLFMTACSNNEYPRIPRRYGLFEEESEREQLAVLLWYLDNGSIVPNKATKSSRMMLDALNTVSDIMRTDGIKRGQLHDKVHEIRAESGLPIEQCAVLAYETYLDNFLAILRYEKFID